jgi:hypothetical protein
MGIRKLFNCTTCPAENIRFSAPGRQGGGMLQAKSAIGETGSIRSPTFAAKLRIKGCSLRIVGERLCAEETFDLPGCVNGLLAGTLSP